MVKHQVLLVVLLETQLAGMELNKAMCRLPCDINRYDIPAEGRSGGILVFRRCSG